MVRVTDDDTVLGTCSADNTVRLYHPESGHVLRSFTCMHSADGIAFHNDLVFVSVQGDHVRTYDFFGDAGQTYSKFTAGPVLGPVIVGWRTELWLLALSFT